MEIKIQGRWLTYLLRSGFKALSVLAVVGLLVPKALVIGILSGWIISHVTLPTDGVLREIANRPYISSVALVFLFLALDALVIYPWMRDPLRSLPSTSVSRASKDLRKAHGAPCSAMIAESPRGKSALAAMRDYPDASLIRLEGRYAVLCAGHDALRDILSTHAADFEKPWPVRSFLARALGWGVIVTEGPLHHRQRRILNPVFHIGKIRMLYGLMWTKVLIFAEKLEEILHEGPKKTKDGWVEVEIAELASRLTLDIIGPAAMGRDFQSLTSNETKVSDAYQELLRPSFGRMIFAALNFTLPQWIVKWLPLSSNRILDEICSFLEATCGEILQEKKREIAEGKNSLPDYSILKRIIETGGLTDEEIKDQMLTFLAAGHETTAGALTWASYLCAKRPEIQRKLRAEIHARLEYVGGQPPEGVSWDVLEAMPYLNGFCEEVLRLYPTVPVTVREAQRATCVAGYRVARGTEFLLVPYATNRNPCAWGGDADKIVPERWIDVDSTTGVARPNKTGGTTSNFASLTFLHGPRACIGQDFAKAELRCAVAGLVGGFEVKLREDQGEPKSSGVITAKAEGGMRLLFKKAVGEEEREDT
ncbi:cytochrome P450 monooxygenase [Apiospora phragmitis]|uniref:Cytochrome P450 monooxygenase n=1 Tax=Apiospora phragmitis TaxID=2905665 RepID=A0ABR1U706_9PEZI